ncbi:MAG: M15 family metallopeptidase [Flavobacteriaceae bacterium]|nr:M15 family metallopeptidase [Flavobacteriaceae bacterium]
MRVLIFFLVVIIFSFKLHDLPEGFIKLNDIDSAIIVDLKYNTKSNFTGKIVRGYKSNTAILSNEASIALINAQNDFKKLGYSLIVFDAYRPQSAVDFFFDWSKDLNDTINKNSYYPNINKSQLFAQGYIAKKSGHSRGSTVDVSLVDLSTMKQIDMGSIYDYFGIQSSTFYPNISDSQKNNRMILYNIMINNGFKNYSKEWWHFTLENEPFQEYFDFLVD